MTEQLATVTIIATGAGNAEKIPPHRRGILSVLGVPVVEWSCLGAAATPDFSAQLSGMLRVADRINAEAKRRGLMPVPALEDELSGRKK